MLLTATSAYPRAFLRSYIARVNSHGVLDPSATNCKPDQVCSDVLCITHSQTAVRPMPSVVRGPPVFPSLPTALAHPSTSGRPESCRATGLASIDSNDLTLQAWADTCAATSALGCSLKMHLFCDLYTAKWKPMAASHHSYVRGCSIPCCVRRRRASRAAASLRQNHAEELGLGTTPSSSHTFRRPAYGLDRQNTIAWQRPIRVHGVRRRTDC